MILARPWMPAAGVVCAIGASLILHACLTMPPLVNIEVQGAHATATVAHGAQVEGVTSADRTPSGPDADAIPPAPEQGGPPGDAPDAKEGETFSDKISDLWKQLSPMPGEAPPERECTLVDAYQLAPNDERADFLNQACFKGEDK